MSNKIELSIKDWEPSNEQLETLKSLKYAPGWNIYKLILQKRFINILNKLRDNDKIERLNGELDGLEYAINIEEMEPQPQNGAE